MLLVGKKATRRVTVILLKLIMFCAIVPQNWIVTTDTTPYWNKCSPINLWTVGNKLLSIQTNHSRVIVSRGGGVKSAERGLVIFKMYLAQSVFSRISYPTFKIYLLIVFVKGMDDWRQVMSCWWSTVSLWLVFHIRRPWLSFAPLPALCSWSWLQGYV